ncbi:hypothetical protein RFI_02612 [Reticulomyxa filosa]|uniref:Uncharacterized protein n=1 Tax=Reticulomyxa filosa TaxID=46433 RepID=X6P8G2_RETFI|nr:hypothetical protein RFI_02612 [Reticulomyxa filosa]|eukprot:ETO34481.1 hypothetical protein RFI_02612 [Reticulomyxa filosa]
MEKNNHNWIFNGISVTISNTHNQNTNVCPLSTDNLMIALLKKEKIFFIFAYAPLYQNCYEARIENIYNDIDTGDTLTNENGKRLLSLCNTYSFKILNLKHAYKKYKYYQIRRYVTFLVPNECVEPDLTNSHQLGRFSILKDRYSLSNVTVHFVEQCKQIKLYDTICEINSNPQNNSIDKITKTYYTFMFWLYETVLNCNTYTYRMTRVNETQQCSLPTNLNDTLQEINTCLKILNIFTSSNSIN